MNIKSVSSFDAKPAELEFRKLVMRMTKRGGADVEMLEKRIKSRNSGTRTKTEFEIMKSSM